MKKLTQYLFNNKLIVAGLGIGAVGGYLYYYFVGCHTGTCAITSNPVNSTIYGAVMGGIFLNIFKGTANRTADDHEKKMETTDKKR